MGRGEHLRPSEAAPPGSLPPITFGHDHVEGGHCSECAPGAPRDAQSVVDGTSSSTPQSGSESLEGRLERLEREVARLGRLVEPEPDFDSGPHELPPQGGLIFEHGFERRAESIEATRVREDGTEELLPVVMNSGKVFATTPHPKGIRVYNTTRETVWVRVRAYRGG